MSELSLHKTEKLCSRTAVNRLFAEGKPAKAYPLRAVYNESNRTYGAAAQFMITIPKKKIRKAVGRVLLRRRVREAYRLNRHLLMPALESTGKKVDIASYQVKDGDVISVREKSNDVEFFKTLREQGAARTVPKWLELNAEKLTGKVIALPSRDDIDLTIEEHLIVEYYSR